MAKPRQNNVGFWLLPPSLILLVTGLFAGGAGTGWTIEIGGLLNLTRCGNIPEQEQTTHAFIYMQSKNVYNMGTIRQGCNPLQRLGIYPKKGNLLNVRTIHTQKESFFNWLVGFTDGNGCFTIDRQMNGKKWNLVYKISQSKKNAQLIYYIKKILNIGNISINCDTYTYRVRKLTHLQTIIFPIFDKYPLFTSKYNQYILIKEAALIQGEEKEEKGKKDEKMERIYNKLKESLKNANIPNQQKNTNMLKQDNYWLIGFWEAEGSLYIVKKDEKRLIHGLGITQKKDSFLQEAIRLKFKSNAKVRYNKNGFYSWDSTSKLVIDKAIKLFDGKFKGRKSLTYSIWKKSINYKGEKLKNSRDLIRKIIDEKNEL